MDKVIFDILMLIVSIVSMLIARYLIPWIKAHMSHEALDTAKRIAEIAVLAAQQIHWEQSGAERKKYAIAYVHDFCSTHGIDISEAQIDALIEAAVKSMKIAEGA